MIKKFKIIATIITLLIISLVVIFSIYIPLKKDKLKTSLNEGIISFNSGNYTVAKADLNSALSEDPDNAKIHEIIQIIDDYEKSLQDYKEGNLNEALNDLNSLPSSYVNYSIKAKIQRLKEAIIQKENEYTSVISSINSTENT